MKTEETTPQNERETTIYEVGYILVPLIAEEDVGSKVTALKDTLDKHSVRTVSEGWPERKVLAYTIEKEVSGEKKSFDNGYFGWIKFEASSEDVEAIDEAFKTNASVLRHLLVKTVKEDTVDRKDILPRREQERRQEEQETASKEEIDKSIDELVVE